MSGLIILGILLLAFWFILVRPQRSRAREQKQLIHDLEPGDEIVSAGGLYGTITSLEDDEARIRIADGVEVRVAKRAIAGVLSEDEEPEEPEELEEETPANLP